MLAMLIIFVLKRCGLSRVYWILLLAPMLIVFVISTGMKASAVRACLMAVLYWGAPFLRRQPNVLTALSLAIIIVLSLSPLQFNDPGFLFSFAIVAGMIVLVPPMHHALTAWIKPDDWAPDDTDPRVIKVRKFATGLMDYIAVSTSAWMVSVPLTALIFHMFSPIALIGNVFAVFFAFIIVVTGMISMLIGTIFLPLAGLLNVLLQKEIAVLLWIIEGLSRVPGGWQYVESPPVLAVLIYYGLLTWLVCRRRMDRLVPVTILIAVISWSIYAGYRSARIQMDVLDVEPGQALYLDLPGDHHVLIDTGPERSASLTFRALQARGVDRIDVLVLTHADPNQIFALCSGRLYADD
jgi:competence protein ComEC